MSSPSPAEIACELPGGGRVLFTTRAAGNLSATAGDGCQHGLSRRAQLCERLDLRWLCASEQVHGASVHLVDRIAGTGGEPAAVQADGHATALRQVGVMILSADCLPVALGCDGAVAMLHAGWRGLAAGVLEEGVRAITALPLRGRCGDGAAVTAVVGPGAGVCCYEVGAQVHAAFAGTPGYSGPHVPDGGAGPIDLRAIARARLHAAGVRHVHDVEHCTICDARFFSYRREGRRAGRQAGIAYLS
ncbi:MAG TPA: polyphenol oxidase family protein [Solirubrobacteraceae bacterium]|nr:polyphenol oxidase family protein [Solirubrobacteraceae bacterium]